MRLFQPRLEHGQMAMLGFVGENLIDHHFEGPGAQHAKETGENHGQNRETEFLPVSTQRRQELVNPKPYGPWHPGRCGVHAFNLAAERFTEAMEFPLLFRSSNGSTQPRTRAALSL